MVNAKTTVLYMIRIFNIFASFYVKVMTLFFSQVEKQIQGIFVTLQMYKLLRNESENIPKHKTSVAMRMDLFDCLTRKEIKFEVLIQYEHC